MTGGRPVYLASDAGGDRMNYHGYAEIYAKYLNPIVNKVEAPTVAETGILKCTGVAMWQDLFPKSKIFGFDFDAKRCTDNFPTLKDRGFQDENVTITRMDQFQDNNALLKKVFGDNKVHVAIDDGYHDPKINGDTFMQMADHLADDFVYFIEDIDLKFTEAKYVDGCSPECEGHDKSYVPNVMNRIQEACPTCSIFLISPSVDGHSETKMLVVIRQKQ